MSETKNIDDVLKLQDRLNKCNNNIIDGLNRIISWYETFTGISRDEIDSIKIKGTDWEAYLEGKDGKK